MAWLNTDWQKELDQVEEKVSGILDEKVEPLLNRAVEKASLEMSASISKAGFEFQDATNHLALELTAQRHALVRDIKALIRYAAIAAFLVVVASVIVITLLGNL